MRFLFYLIIICFFNFNICVADILFKDILIKNPSINKAYFQYQEVRDNSKQVLSSYLPDLTMNYQSYNTKLDNAGNGVDNNYNTDEIGVEMNQVLYQYGVTKILESAKFLKIEYKNLFFASISDVYIEAIRIICEIDSKEKELKFFEKNFNLINNIVDVTEVKFKSGSVNKIDFLQAKTELMNAKTKILQIKRDIRLLKSEFSKVTSIPYARYEIAELNIDIKDFSDLWNKILVSNFNIVASNYRLKASKNSITINKRNFMPEARLFANRKKVKGGYNFNSDDGDSDTTDNIGIKISIPLYKGGYNVAKLSQVKNIYEVNLREHQSLFNNYKNQAKEVFENLKINNELVENQKLYLEFATSLLEAAENNYKYGKTDLLNLLEAQREYNKASFELANVKNQGKYFSYRYLYLIGGLSSDFFKIDLASTFKNI
ncbi:MAG: TolC family protein [Rickettsiales bacterium]|nr:TolC family protein [Rickettsiales bacterium]